MVSYFKFLLIMLLKKKQVFFKMEELCAVRFEMKIILLILGLGFGMLLGCLGLKSNKKMSVELKVSNRVVRDIRNRLRNYFKLI